MEDAIVPAQTLSDTSLMISLVVIVLLMLFSAFFSGSETALTAASRARMFQLEKEGEKRARHVNWLFLNRERMVGAVLLGNTFVNIASSALVTAVLLNLFGDAGVAIATVVTTALVLIFLRSPAQDLCHRQRRRRGAARRPGRAHLRAGLLADRVRPSACWWP
jgi:CBS domain containing-hemolysin-like protein